MSATSHCPQCGAGLFPLDEELALLPGRFTLSLQEALVRLGTGIPFGALERTAPSTGRTRAATVARGWGDGALAPRRMGGSENGRDR